MAKKIGRPKLGKKEFRGDVFSVRLRADEAKDVWDAIETSGQKKPDWMREALLRMAKGKK